MKEQEQEQLNAILEKLGAANFQDAINKTQQIYNILSVYSALGNRLVGYQKHHIESSKQYLQRIKNLNAQEVQSVTDEISTLEQQIQRIESSIKIAKNLVELMTPKATTSQNKPIASKATSPQNKPSIWDRIILACISAYTYIGNKFSTYRLPTPNVAYYTNQACAGVAYVKNTRPVIFAQQKVEDAYQTAASCIQSMRKKVGL